MSRTSTGELWWRFERAPAPLPSEAPSSWFTRVAHAHHLLAEELAELHACSLPALDRGQDSNTLREILERAGIADAPAPCQTVSRLVEEGLFTAAAPRWQLSDWWCYCAACLRRDLSAGRAPYIRNQWVQPLAFACIEHRQALQPWPYGHERLRADASTGFDADALFAVEAPALSDAQLALALCLSDHRTRDWLSWVRCLLAASAALAHKTGPSHDGPPAIWFLTPNDRMPPIKGRKGFSLQLVGELDVCARLSLLIEASRLLVADAADSPTPQVRAGLHRLLSSTGRRSARRPHASCDPLLVVMANLSLPAAEAITQDMSSWPPQFRARMAAALFVASMARLA